ncbi:hypothetical protein QUB25_01340 [Microcoleus sp. B3-D7]
MNSVNSWLMGGNRINQPKALSILNQVFDSIGVANSEKMFIILLRPTKVF